MNLSSVPSVNSFLYPNLYIAIGIGVLLALCAYLFWFLALREDEKLSYVKRQEKMLKQLSSEERSTFLGMIPSASKAKRRVWIAALALSILTFLAIAFTGGGPFGYFSASHRASTATTALLQSQIQKTYGISFSKEELKSLNNDMLDFGGDVYQDVYDKDRPAVRSWYYDRISIIDTHQSKTVNEVMLARVGNEYKLVYAQPTDSSLQELPRVG
jgi:hypothetical protein